MILWLLNVLCTFCICFLFFFSSRRRHTRCALVTGVQTCALPIYPETAERFIEKDHYDGPSYFGLTYAVDPRWSIYASWADVYEPNYDIVAANDRSLAPITGENYETGLKFRAGDGQSRRTSCRERVGPVV